MLVKPCLVYYVASEKSSVTEVDLNDISGGRGRGEGLMNAVGALETHGRVCALCVLNRIK